MALEIKWTKRAKSNFDKIIDYLIADFVENTAKIFVQKSYAIIELLRDFPKMGTLEIESKNVRGFLITKHNRLFYRVTKTNLVLLSFFDTRQYAKMKSIT